MERWRKEKEAIKKEADRDYYRRNRDRKIAKVQKGTRMLKKPTLVETRQALKARAHKEKEHSGKRKQGTRQNKTETKYGNKLETESGN